MFSTLAPESSMAFESLAQTKAVALHCGHVDSVTDIETWMGGDNNSCPHCRAPLDIAEHREIDLTGYQGVHTQLNKLEKLYEEKQVLIAELKKFPAEAVSVEMNDHVKLLFVLYRARIKNAAQITFLLVLCAMQARENANNPLRYPNILLRLKKLFDNRRQTQADIVNASTQLEEEREKKLIAGQSQPMAMLSALTNTSLRKKVSDQGDAKEVKSIQLDANAQDEINLALAMILYNITRGMCDADITIQAAIKNLLMRGADVGFSCVYSDFSPLLHDFIKNMSGVSQHHIRIAKLLISYTQDINQTDQNGNTGLHLAVMQQHPPALIHALLNRNARANLKNAAGHTPLAAMRVAFMKGNYVADIEPILKTAEAAPDKKTESVTTTLVSMFPSLRLQNAVLLDCSHVDAMSAVKAQYIDNKEKKHACIRCVQCKANNPLPTKIIYLDDYLNVSELARLVELHQLEINLLKEKIAQRRQTEQLSPRTQSQLTLEKAERLESMLKSLITEFGSEKFLPMIDAVNEILIQPLELNKMRVEGMTLPLYLIVQLSQSHLASPDINRIIITIINRSALETLQTPDMQGNTPLHWAVSCGQADIVAALLGKKVNAALLNNKGQTAVMLAANHHAIAAMLTKERRVGVDLQRHRLFEHFWVGRVDAKESVGLGLKAK